MEVIRFDMDFSKLDNDEFCTLRLEGQKSKYAVNKEYKVVTPTREFIVKCTGITAEFLKYIQDVFLMQDTDTKSREEAIDLLKTYYPNLTDDSVLTAIWFKKEV